MYAGYQQLLKKATMSQATPAKRPSSQPAAGHIAKRPNLKGGFVISSDDDDSDDSDENADDDKDSNSDNDQNDSDDSDDSDESTCSFHVRSKPSGQQILQPLKTPTSMQNSLQAKPVSATNPTKEANKSRLHALLGKDKNLTVTKRQALPSVTTQETSSSIAIDKLSKPRVQNVHPDPKSRHTANAAVAPYSSHVQKHKPGSGSSTAPGADVSAKGKKKNTITSPPENHLHPTSNSSRYANTEASSAARDPSQSKKRQNQWQNPSDLPTETNTVSTNSSLLKTKDAIIPKSKYSTLGLGIMSKPEPKAAQLQYQDERNGSKSRNRFSGPWDESEDSDDSDASSCKEPVVSFPPPRPRKNKQAPVENRHAASTIPEVNSAVAACPVPTGSKKASESVAKANTLRPTGKSTPISAVQAKASSSTEKPSNGVPLMKKSGVNHGYDKPAVPVNVMADCSKNSLPELSCQESAIPRAPETVVVEEPSTSGIGLGIKNIETERKTNQENTGGMTTDSEKNQVGFGYPQSLEKSLDFEENPSTASNEHRETVTNELTAPVVSMLPLIHSPVASAVTSGLTRDISRQVLDLSQTPEVSRDAEPYFEYSIFQKDWTDEQDENEATTNEITVRQFTNIDEANMQAERLFQSIQQHCQYMMVECNKKRDEHGCMILTNTTAPFYYPTKRQHAMIYVKRDRVSMFTNQTPQMLKGTSFISNTGYALRLFKLIKMADADQAIDSDDSDLDSDTIGHEDMEKEPIRVYHPHGYPEMYTTREAANRAAKSLQIELSHEKNPTNTMTRVFQQKDLVGLNDKVIALEKAGDDEEGYWRSKFNARGRGGDNLELVVEKARICGPRNI